MERIRKQKSLLIILLAVTLCFLAGYYGIFSQTAQPQGESTGSGMRYVIDDAAVPTADMAAEEPGSIKIPGYATLRIPAETETVNIPLTNPDSNPCYFTYEIILSDTGESLYTSQLVEPGTGIQEQTLNRTLPIGEYDTFIKVRTFSLDTLSELNGANLKTKLVVM